MTSTTSTDRPSHRWLDINLSLSHIDIGWYPDSCRPRWLLLIYSLVLLLRHWHFAVPLMPRAHSNNSSCQHKGTPLTFCWHRPSSPFYKPCPCFKFTQFVTLHSTVHLMDDQHARWNSCFSWLFDTLSQGSEVWLFVWFTVDGIQIDNWIVFQCDLLQITIDLFLFLHCNNCIFY